MFVPTKLPFDPIKNTSLIMTKYSNLSAPLLYTTFTSATVAIVLSIIALVKEDKIVYVDTLKLFASYRGSLKAKAEYEKKLAQWKVNVDTLTMELNNGITKYEKDKSTMTVREKKLNEELLTSKRQQLDNYRSAVSENAAKEDQTVTTQIYKEINDFLRRYGESHGYDYILGSTTVGNIVFASKGKNITDDVLASLNNEYSKK